MSAAAETNRRVARLAISWFAVDPVRVEETLRAVEERRQRGEAVDFLQALEEAHILTAAQAKSLRFENDPAESQPLVPAEEDTDTKRNTKLDRLPANGAPVGEPTKMGPYR